MAELIGNITGCIIAGGASTRFGRDKTLYSYRGMPLIESVFTTLTAVFRDTIIIADDCKKFRHLEAPCVPDIVSGKGPIGGLHTALSVCETPYVFVTACDMPFLNPGLIAYMCGRVSNFDIVVPFVGGNYEALHAVYSKNCAPYVRRAIDAGKRRIVCFFDEVTVLKMDENEVSRFDTPEKVFKNINTVEDLNR